MFVPKKKKVPVDIWCPNCGVAHTASRTVMSRLARGEVIKFRCHACGLVCEIRKPTKKKKSEDISVKKVLRTGRDINSLIKLVGKI